MNFNNVRWKLANRKYNIHNYIINRIRKLRITSPPSRQVELICETEYGKSTELEETGILVPILSSGPLAPFEKPATVDANYLKLVDGASAAGLNQPISIMLNKKKKNKLTSLFPILFPKSYKVVLEVDSEMAKVEDQHRLNTSLWLGTLALCEVHKNNQSLNDLQKQNFLKGLYQSSKNWQPGSIGHYSFRYHFTDG